MGPKHTRCSLVLGEWGCLHRGGAFIREEGLPVGTGQLKTKQTQGRTQNNRPISRLVRRKGANV